METPRATRLAHLVHSVGADFSPVDPAARRSGRLQRVQDAWLRNLSLSAAAAPHPGGARTRPRAEPGAGDRIA